MLLPYFFLVSSDDKIVRLDFATPAFLEPEQRDGNDVRIVCGKVVKFFRVSVDENLTAKAGLAQPNSRF